MENVTSSEFESTVLKSDLPVIVDFWAEWCQPCKGLMPKLVELSESYEGKVAFAKVNTDTEDALCTKYGVMSIPTLLFIKDGNEVGRLVGHVLKDTIEKRISEVF